MDSVILVALSITVLFPAAILYMANLFAVHRRLNWVAHGMTFAGWALLVVGLAARVSSEGFPALSTGKQALLAIAAAMLLFHLIQALWKDLPGVGAVIVTGALALMFVATAVPAADEHYLAQIENQWLYLHVLSIVVSMALLIAAAGCATLWLIQHHLLKAKKWAGAFRRLPPLETLDELGFGLAAIGFAALSVGVVTAVVWVATHPETDGGGMPTRIAAFLSWLIYAFYLWARTRSKWRGRKAHYILVVGCIGILLTTSLHQWVFSDQPDSGNGQAPAVRTPR